MRVHARPFKKTNNMCYRWKRTTGFAVKFDLIAQLVYVIVIFYFQPSIFRVYSKLFGTSVPAFLECKISAFERNFNQKN